MFGICPVANADRINGTRTQDVPNFELLLSVFSVSVVVVVHSFNHRVKHARRRTTEHEKVGV